MDNKKFKKSYPDTKSDFKTERSSQSKPVESTPSPTPEPKSSSSYDDIMNPGSAIWMCLFNS